MPWYNAFILMIGILYSIDFIIAIIMNHFPNVNTKYMFTGKGNLIGAGCMIYILWFYDYLTFNFPGF